MFDIVLPIHVAYGTLSFIISSINNIFLLFYMSTFLYVYKIDSTSFYIGETLFLVWNSINDPLFGWISDSDAFKNKHEKKNKDMDDIVAKRLNALSKFGPLFALSFLLFWFQVFPVGLQFSLALCLYDSFLTMVDLHHQSLLADLVIDSNARVKLNTYCSIFSAAGTITVFISFTLWNKEDMVFFQIFCCCIAFFAIIGFNICCDSMKQFYFASSNVGRKISTAAAANESNIVAVKKYIRQVFQHRNFLIFSFINLIQVFHCHFNSNFFPLVLNQLLGQSLAPQSGAVLLGLSFLIPHLNNLYFLQLCRKYGSFCIIQVLFLVKLFLGAIMWKIGSSYWYILCLFVASNRVFTEGTCKLLNLVITDLVDEDYVKFRRKTPVSALIFGTVAFLSKPGQTLAPLLGSYLIYLNTGQSIFLNKNEDGDRNDWLKEVSSLAIDPEIVREGSFRVLVSIPIFSAIMQIIAWHFFSLHGKYLEKIKSQRSVEKTYIHGSQEV